MTVKSSVHNGGWIATAPYSACRRGLRGSRRAHASGAHRSRRRPAACRARRAQRTTRRRQRKGSAARRSKATTSCSCWIGRWSSRQLNLVRVLEPRSRDVRQAGRDPRLLARDARRHREVRLLGPCSGLYAAPPYEKLMINTMNMMNYLERGDLNGARIEARRFSVMHNFIAERKTPDQSMAGPGVIWRASSSRRAGSRARRCATTTMRSPSATYDSLADPVRRLSQLDPYRTPRLTRRINAAPSGPDGDGRATSW